MLKILITWTYVIIRSNKALNKMKNIVRTTKKLSLNKLVYYITKYIVKKKLKHAQLFHQEFIAMKKTNSSKTNKLVRFL